MQVIEFIFQLVTVVFNFASIYDGLYASDISENLKQTQTCSTRNVFEDFSALRKVEDLSSSEVFCIVVLLILKRIRIDFEDFRKFCKARGLYGLALRFAVN